MHYLKLETLPGAARCPGAFLDVSFHPSGELWAACCFLSYSLSELIGTYQLATDDMGLRYEVLIPESEGLREGVTTIRGLYEAGITTKYRVAIL